MFSALKIIASFVLACTYVFACIAESGHPALFYCAGAAFVVGILAAEAFRMYRQANIRSSVEKPHHVAPRANVIGYPRRP